MSLAANCGFLVGCISRGTVPLCLYRVKVAVLAEGLQKLAFNSTQNVPELLHPELPTYWYWGMSGVCDVYDSKHETRCRRQFPPTNNLITIVEESLRDGLGSGQESLVNNIVSSWNATLSNISPSKLRDKEAKFTAESKAAAALALLAIILDGAVLLLGLLLGKYPTLPYLAAFFGAMISIGAGTLATYSMYDGVHGVVETGEHGGLGIIILFVGAALRIFSSIIGPCCRSQSKGDTEGGFPPHSPPYSNTIWIPPSRYPPYNSTAAHAYNSTAAHAEHYPVSFAEGRAEAYPVRYSRPHAEGHAEGYSEVPELPPLDYKHKIGLAGEKHLYKYPSYLLPFCVLFSLTMEVFTTYLDLKRSSKKNSPIGHGRNGPAVSVSGPDTQSLPTIRISPISLTPTSSGLCGKRSANGACASTPDGRTGPSTTSR